MARWVLHLDMDAFYASVEQLTRPTLRDRPVLVGGGGPRGVVAGASYQARVHGARSAMPMSQARRRCPHAVVLPPRGGLYQVVSQRVMAVLRESAPALEQVSLDEAFLEPPALAGANTAQATRFCAELRERVRSATGLAASVGAGSGKQVAKIGSELAKPDGLRVIAHGDERAVLGPLPVRALWGVGPVAEAVLLRVGVLTVGELAALDVREITSLLGQAVGAELHRLANGVDHRPVAERGAAKQVSAETTFDTDLTAMPAVHAAVERMTGAAHARLVASGRAARTVTVKARSADFSTASRSETAMTATTELAALTATAQRLVRSAIPEGGVRLIGVSLSGLSDAVQERLFDGPVAEPATPDTAGSPEPAVHSESFGHSESPQRSEPPGPGAPDDERPAVADRRLWRAGDDVHHPAHGHGWVQGAGHGRVTVRFETRASGPGRAITIDADEPGLQLADPLASLDT